MGELISGDREWTLEETSRYGARAATGLASAGVGKGDAVALYLRNDAPFFEALVATSLLGAYPVPVNWHYVEDEARYLLENSGAKAMVIHADLLEGVRGVVPEGTPVYVVETPEEIRRAYGLSEGECVVKEGDVDWYEWLGGYEPAAASPLGPPSSVIYTSGTTGRPKGVRRNMPTPEQTAVFMGTLQKIFGFTGDPKGMVTVVTGPMYHSAPNAYGAVIFRLGGKVILEPRFDPEEFLGLVEKHGITHVHMVPTMFVRLLKLPKEVREKYDLSSLKCVTHAAAPCPPQVKEGMIEWFGPIINEYYGSTEVSGLVFCTSEEWLAHRGTVGKPLEGATVKILNEAGEEVPTGEVGDVACWLSGMPDFTYIGDDEKRRASERGGLILPGDVGYMDGDGYLYLCDRSNDMVISGGVNIYPIEIENELHGMPGVEDCAVFGVPDEEFGEALLAVVQPVSGVALDEAGVREFLLGRLAKFKVPRKVEFRRDLPREDSGKIFKRKLRAPYWEGAGRSI